MGELDEEDYMDESMQQEDTVCQQEITNILNEHRRDILNYIPPQPKTDMRDKKMNKVQSKLAALSGGVDIDGTPSATVRKVRESCVVLEKKNSFFFGFLFQ